MFAPHPADTLKWAPYCHIKQFSKVFIGGENKAAVFWDTTDAPCAVVVSGTFHNKIMPVHCSEMSSFFLLRLCKERTYQIFYIILYKILYYYVKYINTLQKKITIYISRSLQYKIRMIRSSLSQLEHNNQRKASQNS